MIRRCFTAATAFLFSNKYFAHGSDVCDVHVQQPVQQPIARVWRIDRFFSVSYRTCS